MVPMTLQLSNKGCIQLASFLFPADLDVISKILFLYKQTEDCQVNIIMEVGVNVTGVQVCTRNKMKVADFSKKKNLERFSRRS